MQIRARHKDRGLHGHKHIDRSRLTAIVLVVTGLIRSALWLTLGVFYLAGVPFTKALFASVAFVALISLYANAATDFGQACASLAQLTAGDAHHDAEAARRNLAAGTETIERDLEQLAELHPGPEATELAARIAKQIAAAPTGP